MTARARVVILVALTACHRTPTTARERALAKLPGGTEVLVVADGPVLADPAIRRVMDASRSRLPTSFRCVIDAAMQSDAAALSGDRTLVAVVLIARGTLPKCAPLSKIAADTYVATIGGALADTETTPLTDAKWDRARKYLLSSPIAFAAELDELHLVGAAQADPIDVWLTIDAPGLEQSTRAELAIGSALGSHLDQVRVKRTGTQLLYTLPRGATIDAVLDLAATVGGALDRDPAPPPTAELTCPTHALVRECKGGKQLVVSSVREILELATQPRIDRVVENGEVVGVRLAADAPVLLREGDVIVAIDARRVTTVDDVLAVARRSPHETTLMIRRGKTNALIELRE